MVDCFIYDSVRSPRGRGTKEGSLHELTTLELATQVLAAVRDRNNLDTSCIDDVVLGVAEPIGEAGGNLARVAVLNAEYDQGVGGLQISRLCASGLEAVNIAVAKVASGQAEMTIGGGAESMSRIGMGASGGSWSTDPGVALKTYFVPIGIGADLIATLHDLSRNRVDEYAVESQRRAKAAWDRGYFDRSIIPVNDINGLALLDRDENLRPDATVESLAHLKPSFAGMGKLFGFDSVARQRYPMVDSVNHVHHPGNSAGPADGAAAILLGSKAAGERLGLHPRARIRAFATVGSEPCVALTGGAPVMTKVLRRARMVADDVDLFELNETFSSVVLLVMQQLGIGHDKMNVNGGAIAMGHPPGAGGAMILGTVLDELERRNLGTALAAICGGMGMGVATIIERI